MRIHFEKISYIYDRNLPFAHTALSDIELDIREGKITAIIGETGSGKSTLVQHLNALLIPSSGQIELGDHLIKANEKNKNLKKLRKEVGLVFQFPEYQLFESTILDDVAFGPIRFGISKEESYERARSALSNVGISPILYDRNPMELSGGQKRRVAIAGILALDPKILVLDEPAAGLDPEGAKRLVDLIVSLNREFNKTIILVSHDNDMVYSYTDDTVFMRDGRVIYHGPTLDLFNNGELIKKNHLLLPTVVNFKNRLREAGFEVDENARTIEQIAEAVSRRISR